jgi:hypothetical protein
MKMKRSTIASITALVAVLLMISGNHIAYAQIACPQNISADQKATAPADWSVDYSKAPTALSSVTIFDGAPEEQASLKYDDQRTTGSEIIQVWKLPASDRRYWIECGYTNTSARLRRKLPGDIGKCEVVLEKGVTFGNGGAVVKSARCVVGTGGHAPSH